MDGNDLEAPPRQDTPVPPGGTGYHRIKKVPGINAWVAPDKPDLAWMVAEAAFHLAAQRAQIPASSAGPRTAQARLKRDED